MAAVSATADVRTVDAYDNLASSAIQEPLNTFQNWFTRNYPTVSATREPSRKRRKLDNGDSIGFQPFETFEEGKSVVLAKVSINLRFPALAADRINPSSEDLKPLNVCLESFARDSAHEFRISLRDRRNTASGVNLTVTTKSLESIAVHLDAAATLRTTLNGRKRSNKAGAAFCRCVLYPPTQDQDGFKLEIEIRFLVGFSVVETLGPKTKLGRRDLGLLTRYFPDGSTDVNTAWALSDFYDSVHVPSTDTEISPKIQRSLSETKLYPFQQRAVDWLLRREGVAFPESGGDISPVDASVESNSPSFRLVQDANGETCYVSHLRGLVVPDLSMTNDPHRILKGGILCEEMGLGKTVELIALMCLNKRKLPGGEVYDAYTGAKVKSCGSTLIITPPSILEQWKNEIHAHAPELKVLHYKGLPPQTGYKKDHEAATVDNLMRHDVVLTTYNVLSREIHYAQPTLDRSLRHAKHYQPRKSPLVQISWWRVCLDEAQMVESGVSQAATVARVIPRCNAWAVSGTPLRKDIRDLRGLLTFLRYEPFCDCKAVWDRLDKLSFRTIFNRIAMRHSKDKIRQELRLPPQKRIVITVPFTAIEEQNYSEMMRQMCYACGLSQEGIPVQEDQDANDPEVIERMREWLVRLRQTCLHAHVGRRNRKALGAKNGPLRTVDEVLEVMIDQNDTLLKSEAREYILAQLACGHIKANAKDDERRSEHALEDYGKALEDSQSYVRGCRDELSLEKQKVGHAAAGLKDSLDPDNDQDSDNEDKGGEYLGRVPAIRKVLRSFLELEHACKFFIGTSYFQMKSNENLTKPESEDFRRLEKLEVDWYDKAKTIRKELLRESQSKAQRQMAKISSRKPFPPLPRIADLADLGGIENRKVLDMMDGVNDILNAQATQLEEWRQKIVDILLMPLVDEDEGKETTGDEYEDSTKVQDELYVYIMALRTLVADRNTAVNGLQDLLVEHELKAAEAQARLGLGHAPELVLKVAEAHQKLKPSVQDGSLKGIVSAVRSLLTSLQWPADGGDDRAATELAIVQKQFLEIQRISTMQAKVLTDLEKEQEMFRAAMNQRLEFYRQLQHISDTVAPWREELDEIFDAQEHIRQTNKRTRSSERLRGLKTKHTYLTNLRGENQKDMVHECIICKDDFEIGVLTICGHKYCKECINMWWHEHRNCPMCKRRLYASDFHDISFKPSEMKAQEEDHDQEGPSQPSTPVSSNTSIYSDISDSTMKEIKAIDLDGSYGTKIDMIARHLLWIRHNDPGAKSIIFSQFGDFLEVLREALKKWKVGASSISDKNGIHNFRTDPAVESFLLDAKSDSSGLNLVNATYVFLCEPLINPAIELQAIARVHRIGQQRPTTVFMYLISDTVEEAIYDISVSRRLEHMGRRRNAESVSRSGTATPAVQENALDAANSMEMEAAPLKQLLRKKGDGEIVQVDDLWNCLFGKPRKQQRAVLEREVGRHLRAEAAEQRIAQAAEDHRSGTACL
ncbi:hypothetical protein K469DRAFT_665964 [Zopfia rhizophila CBS 207.26]|uniref:ATP-dependent DNA helicase n=1 Tax=Zopfia rhizophila CBS 207.26 TaxID=1314779 RepID=A0A6A6DZJ9_9PEZI|nr:hypothetical protein K469DRAFT_665964 [Zopfia rhizophila CBS 207.26]